MEICDNCYEMAEEQGMDIEPPQYVYRCRRSYPFGPHTLECLNGNPNANPPTGRCELCGDRLSVPA